MVEIWMSQVILVRRFKIAVPDIVNENLSEIEILMKISEKLDIDL